MTERTILVVDDDPQIRNVISIYLRNEGYQVLQADGGKAALECLKQSDLDLVILDIMMPEMDGIEACLRIRDESPVPVIMLSARSEALDKIHGLTAGGDDYMTKPFNPLELIARVKAQLRRHDRLQAAGPARGSEITVDDLAINPATRRVTVRGEEVSLTPKEFGILELLARNRGIVFSAEQIYEHVWNDPFLDSANTVMAHIRNLREKLETNPRQPRYIKTVWGVGYRIDG